VATQWPSVVAALVSTFQGAAGPSDAVYDGPPVGSDLPVRWVTVGWVQENEQAASGQVRQVQSPDGFQWDEAGTVLCEIVAQTGDVDLPGMRSSAFAFLDVLTTAVRKDRTLGGVLSKNGTTEISLEPIPQAAANGTEFWLRFTVTYTTTTL
jgi:hypothetical protein